MRHSFPKDMSPGSLSSENICSSGRVMGILSVLPGIESLQRFRRNPKIFSTVSRLPCFSQDVSSLRRIASSSRTPFLSVFPKDGPEHVPGEYVVQWMEKVFWQGGDKMSRIRFLVVFFTLCVVFAGTQGLCAAETQKTATEFFLRW